MLYDDFKPVVDLLFNNWTALQLAVEHGMGAPGGMKTAQLMSAYVARYCVENEVNVHDLQELLEDLMDEEFETTCRDDSPKELASLLLLFLEMLKAGQHEELKARLDTLPKCQIWLSTPVFDSIPPQTHGNPDDDTTSSEDDGDENYDNGNDDEMGAEVASSSNVSNPPPQPMDEDIEPGWTVVKGKRKK